MLKAKTTKKNIMSSYKNVISIGYCDACYLLRPLQPQFYTCGVYGWNSDIYQYNYNVAIVTGYRPFGNIHASYNKNVSKYNEKARKIYDNYELDYEAQDKKVMKLLDKFIMECLGV